MTFNLTPKVERALVEATCAHRNDTRKGTDIPYITHPVSVAILASQVTEDENVLCAALLHDVLEDTDYMTVEEMERQFGHEVVSIVTGVTKDTSLHTWLGRANSYLAHLEEASTESLIVCTADKVHNLSCTLEDYERLGDELWKRFSPGSDQRWWYQQVLAVLSRRLPGNALVERLAEMVGQLERSMAVQ